MRKILVIILYILPIISIGQEASLLMIIKNGKIVSFQNNAVAIIPDTVYLSDTFNYTTNQWIDQSGNDNHFSLVNSYMINVTQPGSFIGAQIINDDTLQLVNGVKIKWAINASADALVIGGTNTLNYIVCTNTLVRLNTDQGFELFSVPMVSSSYNTWNEYELEVIGSDIKVTNLTTGVYETEVSAVTTSLTLRFLFGRGGTSPVLQGKCAYIAIDSVSDNRNEWAFSEGYVIDDTLYSIIDRYGELHAKPTTEDAISYTLDNDYQHVNIQYGFSFYEDGGGNTIRIPYINGDTATVDSTNFGPNFGLTNHSPAGSSYHNNAETGLIAPTALKPYDYDNFLFKANGDPDTLLFENIPENLNNQFYSNKSVLNQLTDFLIYNIATE